MGTLITFVALIGGLLFFPLLKLAAVTRTSRGKTMIYIALLIIGFATLRSCQDELGGVTKVVSSTGGLTEADQFAIHELDAMPSEPGQ